MKRARELIKDTAVSLQGTLARLKIVRTNDEIEWLLRAAVKTAGFLLFVYLTFDIFGSGGRSPFLFQAVILLLVQVVAASIDMEFYSAFLRNAGLLLIHLVICGLLLIADDIFFSLFKPAASFSGIVLLALIIMLFNGAIFYAFEEMRGKRGSVGMLAVRAGHAIEKGSLAILPLAIAGFVFEAQARFPGLRTFLLTALLIYSALFIFFVYHGRADLSLSSWASRSIKSFLIGLALSMGISLLRRLVAR
jgi:hypothetical protein